MDVTLNVRAGSTYESSLAIFVPAALVHREAESTAWWYSEAGQKAEQGYLTTVDARRSRVIRVRAIDGTLPENESTYARQIGSDELNATAGPIYVGAMEELPQSGSRLRDPARQFLPLPAGRYQLQLFQFEHRGQPWRRLHSTVYSPELGCIAVNATKKLLWDCSSLRARDINAPKGTVPLALTGDLRAPALLASCDDGLVVVKLDTGGVRRVSKQSARLAHRVDADHCLLVLRDRLGVAGDDKQVALFNVKQKRTVRAFTMASPIVAMGHRNNEVVVFTQDGKVSVMNMQDKAMVDRTAALGHGSLEHGVVADGVAVSIYSDGEALATDLDSKQIIWKASSGLAGVTAAGFNGDAMLLAGQNGGLALFAAHTGRLLRDAHSAPVAAIHAVSADVWLTATAEKLQLRGADLGVRKEKVLIRRKKGAVDPATLPDLLLQFQPVS